MESTVIAVAINKTKLPWRSVKRANMLVIAAELSLAVSALPLPNNIMPAGITTKATTRARLIPIVIIQPKSITGRMLLTTSDIKATIVVSTV